MFPKIGKVIWGEAIFNETGSSLLTNKLLFIAKGTIIILFFILFLITPLYSYAVGVTLAWDAPAGGGAVKGYNLYYWTLNQSNPNKVGGINNTQYTLSGLDEDKVYHFMVKAYNDAGESQPSNVKSWKYSDTTPPLPPDGVNAN